MYLRLTEMFEIELSELLLNWIAWNRIIFGIETVYLCSTELFKIELFWHIIELFWHLTLCKQKIFLYKTELFEI